MQVDVNSTANRVQLIRTQLTAAQGSQFKPKAELAKDGNGLAKAASTAVQTNPDIRTTRSFSAAAPTKTRTAPDVRPDVAGNTNLVPGPDTKPADPLEALLADWGQKDSPYDLDKNGIVGMSDLLILLARMSGDGPQQPNEPHGDVAADPARASVTVADQPKMSDPSYENPGHTDRLDALLEDWGKRDSPYDLDNNGIVGMSDLLMLLARMSGDGPQQPNEPHGDVAADPARTSVTVAEPPAPTVAPPDLRSATGRSVAIGVKSTTIAQQVVDSLDQDNSGTITPPEVGGSTPTFDRLDRNEDGVLSRSELASQIRDMLLDQLAKGPSVHLDRFVQEAITLLSDNDKADDSPSERKLAIDRFSGIYQQTNLAATARQLVRGLTDQGAMELRRFVQAGELSGNEKRTVLDQISLLRPGAQRVNLVG